MTELSGTLGVEGFRKNEALAKWAFDTFNSAKGKLFLSALRNQALVMAVNTPITSESSSFSCGRIVGRAEMLDNILACAVAAKSVSDVEPTYGADGKE